MASIFDQTQEQIVECATWEDAVAMGFKDSQTISPWYRYSVEVSHPTLGIIYETMAMFFPERKAHPILGPTQDEPGRLSFKSTINGEYQNIINPTIEDLRVVTEAIETYAKQIK
jgi:hypothetical protein